MAGAPWVVPYDRVAVMRTFVDELRPFVAKFVYDWPMDITDASVRNAITQCITLHKFASTICFSYVFLLAIDRLFT